MHENANSYYSFPFLTYFILAYVQGLNALIEVNA